MKRTGLLKLAMLILMAFMLKTASAQLLLEENFNFSGLLSDNGWTVHGVNAKTLNTTTGSLTFPGYLSSGVGNMALVDTVGEDLNRTFTQTDTGSIYVSCLVNVSKATAAGDYFLHIGPATIGTTFRARAHVKYDSGTDKIAFGISKTNNTPDYTAFDYDLNTTYLLVVKYKFSPVVDDTVYLYVNPVINGSEPVALVSNTSTGNDLSNAGTVALRQGASASAPRLTLDGIRVGKLWSDVLPFSNSGIIENYVITNTGGGNNYDLDNTFNGKDFGNIPSNSTFTLKGGQVKTWKNDPPDDITGARMFYRIYEELSTPGAFTSVALPWSANLPTPGEQVWENNTLNLNIINGLTNADYVIETYFEADYTTGGTPGIYVDNNAGANYKATFAVTAPVAQSGIFERYIVTNTGSNIYTEGVPFNSSNLGSFLTTDVLILKGGQVKTFKNVPPDDITGARMFYRIYAQSATPPIFTSLNLPWSANLPNLNDQLWENITANVDMLNGLTVGNYFLEVYFEADYTSNSVPGIHVDNNSGANYKASFSVTSTSCPAVSIPYSEGFNAATIPNCWTQIQEGGATINWAFVTSATNPSAPFEGTHFARLSSSNSNDNKVKLVSPEINLSSATMPYVKFRHYQKNWTGDQDELRVFYRTSSSSSWVQLAEYTGDVPAWTERKLFLPNPSATYQIAFEGNAKFGYGVAIDQVVVDVPPAKDFAMIEWVSPQSSCGLTATQAIIVKVANVGSQAQSNVPIVASIDGGQTIIGPEILPGIIQPGDTITYTFVNTANLANPGIYYSGAVVLLSGDMNNANDTVITTIYNTPLVNSFPYVQNFDTYSGWAPGIIAGSQQWELGLPAQTQLVGDYSGTMQNAWMTKLSTNYDNSVNVYLMSPCLNFTNLAVPMFSAYLNIKTEANWDAMVLESSTDDGLTWDKVVGDAGFYNNTSASGPVAPPKWSGTNNGWTKYETSIPYLAGEPDVRLRFRFQSDGSTANEGIAIDEIRIYQPVANDVGVFSVISPVNSLCGNTNDTLKVVVSNYGSLAQDTIPVKIKVVKPDNSIMNFTDTLFSNLAFSVKDTLVTFTLNTLMPGTYHVTAYTALTGDMDVTNDTTHYTFTVTPPQAVPYVQDFEGTVTGWSHNMTIGQAHGLTSNAIYKNLYDFAPTGFAQSPKLGTISTGDFLLFDYRIVDFSSPWPASTLTADDTIKVFISTDCGATFVELDTIYDANHVPATTMITKQYNLDAYAGDDVIVRFEMQCNDLADYFVDIDNFIIASVPVVALGNDTAVCDGESVTLDAGNAGPFTTYSWVSDPVGFTSILQSITVTPTECTTYIVTVDNGLGMTDADTIVICVNPKPELNLGPDVQICSTGSTTLDAGLEISTIHSQSLRGVLPNGWTMNNAAGQAIEQTTAGGYMLLDDAGDWVVSETYNLTGVPQVKLYVDIASYGAQTNHNLMLIDVSSDNGATWVAQFPFVTDTTTGTTYVTQGPFSVTASGAQVKFRFRRPNTTGKGVRFRDFKVTSSAPYAAYLWSTGASTQTINVSTSGSYWAEVTTVHGCTDRDTINIDYFNVPVIDFGTDTAICAGDVLILDAGTGFTTYTWHNNSNLQTFNVTTAGTYSVVAEDANGCISGDTISVIINPIPVVNLGPDADVCSNQTLVLDAGAGINYSYSWKQSGSGTVIGTLQTLPVNTAGTFVVVVDNGCTMTATDTITVAILQAPSVHLGPDTTICPQAILTLDAGTQNAYLWSNNATTQTINVSNAGTYWAQVTAVNQCTDRDTIVVSIHTVNPLHVENDTTICIYNNILLNAGPGYTSYLWFDNSTSSALLVEGSVHGLGILNAWVTVTDANGCEITDTVVIDIDPCTGINDISNITPEIYPNPSSGIVNVNVNTAEQTLMQVYNVHGQLLKDIITEGNTTIELNLGIYGKGVYVIKMITGEQVSVGKVVIQ